MVGGEDGVSPGQACVFYEAADGQARVLGGGVIAGTTAAPRAKTPDPRRSRGRALIAASFRMTVIRFAKPRSNFARF